MRACKLSALCVLRGIVSYSALGPRQEDDTIIYDTTKSYKRTHIPDAFFRLQKVPEEAIQVSIQSSE